MDADTPNKPPPSTGDDSNIGLIIGIFIFLVLVILIAAAIIGWAIADRPSPPPPDPSTQRGLFLSSCVTTPCAEDLICDGTAFVCKLSTGATCTDFTDCATGLICSGICATGATGGLNQLCPCNSGYLCVRQNTGLTICKGGGGTECTSNADCASGLCQSNNTCAAGAPNSFPCNMDSQCASGNCSIGFCQAQGVVSGAQGSACAACGVGFTGAVCTTSPAHPVSCQCLGGQGVPGTCLAATQGVISVCSEFRACSTDLECLTFDAMTCEEGDTGGTGGNNCICVYPYDNPNVMVPGSSCIPGMSNAVGSQQCLNNVGLGCDIGGMCSSLSCGGPPVLAYYQFSAGQVNLRTTYMGALSTSISAGVTGITGLIQPHKMFSTSNGNVDTIYLVDNLQGLLSLQFNPINGTVFSSWTQIIPHTSTTTVGNTTTTKTLMDAGYNGNTFIVAFDETVVVSGTGGSTRQNDTVYTGTSLTSLSPFNFQSGSGITGTQYTTGGTSLSIDYIDISPANDYPGTGGLGGDVLISFNGTIYVKQNTQTQYSIGVITGGPMNVRNMTGLTGPARFYYDNMENPTGTGSIVCPEDGSGATDDRVQCPSYLNISFIGSFVGFGGGVYDQVVQFSGNVAGIADPIDRFENTPFHVQYRVFDYSIYSPQGLTGGMPQAGMITLTNAYNNGSLIDNIVAVSYGGNTTPLPYKISNTSRSVATANAFYILSIASCS